MINSAYNKHSFSCEMLFKTINRNKRTITIHDILKFIIYFRNDIHEE